MKFFYLLFLFLLYYNTSFCIQQKYDFFTRQSYTQEDGELQKIRKLKINKRFLYSAYYNKKEELPARLSLVEEIDFNKDGLPSEKKYFNWYNTVNTRYVYEYNNYNDLVKEEVYNESNNIIFRKEISYDASRDTSEIVVTNIKRKGKEKSTYNYKTKGMLSNITRYDSDGKVYLVQNFTYDNNKLKSIVFFDGNRKKLEEVEFTYNQFGSFETEKQNNLVKKYIYDNKNRLVRVESNNGDIRIYKYNDKNFIVDDQFFLEFKKRQFRLVFSYLKNGLTDEVIRYDPDDKKAFYSKYTYE